MAKNDTDQVYELGYNIISTLPEDEVAVKVGAFKALLEKLGAELISDQYPEFIDLAYEMSRTIENKRNTFASAYFGWIKFALDAEKIEELKKVLDDDNNILRYLLIKTVRENTIVAKKPLARVLKTKVADSAEPETAEEEGEIDEGEVDAKIDQLVNEDLTEGQESDNSDSEE
jgi:ribosomal protein S6